MPVDIDGGWSIPRFIAQTNHVGTAADTGFTIATPTGTIVGDYMFLAVVTNKDTITPDAKFTLIQNDLDSANQWSTALYSRVATAADAAGDSYTWALSATTNAPNTSVLMSFRDVNAGGAVIVKAYTALTTNPVTTPTVTSTVPSLILTGACCRNGAGATIKTFTGSGNERIDGGNHAATTSYMQAWYDSGSVSYTIGSNTGNSVTISDTTNLTDRMSYSVALPARKYNPGSPSQNLMQAIDRSTRW